MSCSYVVMKNNNTRLFTQESTLYILESGVDLWAHKKTVAMLRYKYMTWKSKASCGSRIPKMRGGNGVMGGGGGGSD